MSKSKNWLLLRGLSRGQGHWGDFVQKFQALVPEDKVLLVDLPGNGERYGEHSPTLISETMQEVRALALQQAGKSKLHLIAISMGAMVAVDWMREHPNEIQQSFLINTSAGNFSKPWDRFQLAQLLKSFWRLRAEEFEARVLSVTSNNPARARAFCATFSEYSKAHPVSLPNFLRQIWAASLYQFPTQAPGRVYLLVSAKDRLVKASCTSMIAKNWSLPIEVHPTAGHDLPLDDPEWLCQKIIAKGE